MFYLQEFGYQSLSIQFNSTVCRMPRSSSRSASKPAEKRSGLADKRVTRESVRSPASAAGKRTPAPAKSPAAARSPAAAVSTPKSAAGTPRGRSAARTPAKKSSPSPRASG